MAVLALAFGGTAAKAEENMPAILKNVASKHQVVKLDKSEMNEVRGDLVLPINLIGSTLTITLLEQNAVLRLTSVGTSGARPASTTNTNILGLLFSGTSTPAQGSFTTTTNLGILDTGRLVNYQSTKVANP
ncbi:hypothetical protein [Phragmitibacter flavus]|nr:hypothetical protein [Phragmitibacter flavus]